MRNHKKILVDRPNWIDCLEGVEVDWILMLRVKYILRCGLDSSAQGSVVPSCECKNKDWSSIQSGEFSD
jgi:hypothetical protein